MCFDLFSPVQMSVLDIRALVTVQQGRSKAWMLHGEQGRWCPSRVLIGSGKPWAFLPTALPSDQVFKSAQQRGESQAKPRTGQTHANERTCNHLRVLVSACFRLADPSKSTGQQSNVWGYRLFAVKWAKASSSLPRRGPWADQQALKSTEESMSGNVEEIDKHVFRKYEIHAKLGKGVSVLPGHQALLTQEQQCNA